MRDTLWRHMLPLEGTREPLKGLRNRPQRGERPYELSGLGILGGLWTCVNLGCLSQLDLCEAAECQGSCLRVHRPIMFYFNGKSVRVSV